MNKNRLKQYISRLYRFLPSFYDPNSLRILLYHSINSTNISNDLWSLELQKFQSHLDYLMESDFDIYAASDLKNFIPKHGIVITFDDGLKNNYEVAAPELISRKMPFTIFVIGEFIKKSKNNYLTKEMLRELSQSKYVTIGSHSFTHKRLDECSPKQLKYEIYSSKVYLEDLLGMEVDLFSYPFGAHNNLTNKELKNAGYKLAFTSNFFINPQHQDKLLLNRNEIWNTDNLEFFIQKLDGDWDWLRYRTKI